MKKLAIIAACLLTSLCVYGQGQLNFDTYTPDAKVYSANGQLATTAYVGQLLGSTTETGSFTPLGSPTAFMADTEADGAGYIISGAITINGVFGGSDYWIMYRAWNLAGGSYDAALERGESGPLKIKLGGAPETGPASPPADLTGLQGFTMTVVPEPATIALGALGLAVLMLRRRN